MFSFLKLFTPANFWAWFLKHLPQIILFSAIGGLALYTFIDVRDAFEEVKTLNAKVASLETINKTIQDANKALTQDMAAVKKGMETYQSQVSTIEQNSKKLATDVSTPEFKALAKTDRPAAEKKFNDSFNNYLKDFQAGTQNAK